ncbi:MAG: hypothetical protein ABI884_12850 [Gemmatimonadota bacterium]
MYGVIAPKRPQLRGAEERRSAIILHEVASKKGRDCVGSVLRFQQPPWQIWKLTCEHLLSARRIERLDVGYGSAPREKSGDDRARARSGEHIVDIGQHEILSVVLLAKELLDPRSDLEREDSANPATIEGKNAFRFGRH